MEDKNKKKDIDVEEINKTEEEQNITPLHSLMGLRAF